MAASDPKDVEILGLQTRIATLEQLLEVYERSVIEQSEKLYTEQERMGFQKTLLECQGEASLDGILSIGADGQILFANRRLSEMWGVAGPVVGTRSGQQVLQALADRTMDPAAFADRLALLQGGEESREEIALSDGRTFDQYTAPIRNHVGEDLGRVWYFRDISAFKEVGRMKDDFLSAVSHDLRTPLTSIRGSLGLMASGALGKLPDDASDIVKTAQRNCDRLVRLINDVLDIEKIEAGRMDFQMEVVALQPLLEHSVEAMRPYGDQLSVTFRIETDTPDIRVRVDPDRLLQVMENLLSNAAKFSPPGGVVQVSLVRRGRYVRVSVKDRGPGIARWFQRHLFEKFAQGAPKDPRRKGGTGLGLNISRAIVEGLGGTIGFVSQPGAGATFHFDLPESRDGEAAGVAP